jgi:hypothetical protein
LKLTSRLLVGVVFASVLIPASPQVANASTQCNDLQARMQNAMSQSRINVSEIQRNAVAFRQCMRLQADSSNVGDVIGVSATGPFYSLFTSANTYRITNGRSVARAALSDYRDQLDGMSPSRKTDCDIYMNFIGAALAYRDVALGATAVQAQRQCFAGLQVEPRGTVQIVGDPLVGNQLSSRITGYFNVGMAYQWFANGVRIPNATASAYNLQLNQAGQNISVAVTFQRQGLVSNTRTSSAVTARAPALQINTPSPTISGIRQVGGSLTAVPGSWDTGVSLSYQWLRNDVEILGASQSTYTLVPADGGTSMSVRVTGTRPGFVSASRTSSPTEIPTATQLSVTPIPTISGIGRVGETFSAVAGTWDSGVSLSYQWLRNGGAILGATGVSYTLSSSDIGQSLSVRVTGTKLGFTPVSQVSSGVSIVDLSNLTLTPSPSISGVSQAGNTLTAAAGSWDSGVSLSYQWLRNGVAILGATSETYTLGLSDVGQSLSVRIAATKIGFHSVTRTSSSVNVTLQNLLLTPIPEVSGTAEVGSTLTADSKIWDSGVSLTYQWLRNGSPISGAVSESYTLGTLDAGQAVSVRVTGTKTNFATVTRTSLTTSVALQNLSVTSTPSISGVPQVGNTLSASVGSWDSGVALSYQWLRNNIAVSGAISSSYLVTVADVGQSISVRVTGSKVGFTPVSRTSDSLTGIPLSDQNLTPTPSISGDAFAGRVLTAVPGTWDSGVSISYQWLRNGFSILGAIGNSYTLTSFDVGQNLSVQVRGAKPGFNPVSKTSSTVLVTLPPLTLAPTPSISGASFVGTTLSAVTGTWDSGVVLSYQWLRNGTISLGSANTYTLTAADAGHSVSVRVTGTKPGFSSASRLSGSITAVPLSNFSLTPSPVISGTAQIGNTLNAMAGTWDSGVSLRYQWLRNGAPISGASSNLYILTANDVGRSISVRVTGEKLGFNSVIQTSSAVAVTLRNLNLTPIPTVIGNPILGSTLTASAGTWDPGVTLSYQWFRNAAPITGATSSTYPISSSNLNSTISVQVTGSATNYTPVSKTSAPTILITPGLTFATAPKPSIVGIAAVGQTLSVETGNWSEVPTEFTYSWFTRSSPTGAGWWLAGTGPTYTVKSSDRGTSGAGQIYVQVTGHRHGYISRSEYSAFSAPVAAGLSFTSVGAAPTIVGTVAVGQTLTASFANAGWTPAPTTVTYEWYSRTGPTGVSWRLVGTGPSYTVTSSDRGVSGTGQLYVAAVGSSPGYINRTLTSSVSGIAAGLSFTSVGAAPTIVGTVAVGQTLTASFANAGWTPAPTTVTYEWYSRTGPTGVSWRLVGTGPSYTVTSSDRGVSGTGQLYVAAVGSSPGYINRTLTSSVSGIQASLAR